VANRLAVIGGDAGGMSAATQARRLDPSLEIVAFEKTEWTSYSACGIPYLVSGEIGALEQLVARSPQEHRDQSHIDVRVRHEVMSIDLPSGRLEVRDHVRGRTIQVPFDMLLLGMGARPIRPDIPGVDLPIVHGVQTLHDAIQLLQYAERSRCSDVVVVGGGYIGLELAEAFVERQARVTVIESQPHVMSTLDGDIAATIEEAMRKLGIELRLNTEVIGFEEDAVVTRDGRIAADLVIVGIGVEPNSALARDAGIELGVRRSVRVDRRQRTSAPNVWAAGDCVESFHIVSRRPVYVALGTVANRQGRVAGINIGGGYAAFAGIVGTAVTRICATEISRTGLNEREARDAAFETVTATVDSTTTASYFPEAPKITVKLLAERRSGRIIGAQIVGGRGAGKRIDVAAAAITAGMDAGQLVDLDFGYAPPVSPLWDPIASAARVILSKL
jgi:NADPH-dependent 2,4-dienoyl-CoA reductase/sulfur reductase-like enzyme